MQWNYEEAFSRNIGLVTKEEQAKIKNTRIAIGGMGGVGGVHLVTLIRMGFTKFTIADFDTFEVANFNRQFGATINTVGQEKAKAMKEYALSINPEADIKVISTALCDSNLDDFLEDASIYVDGLDVFVIDIRRKVFNKAREKGIWSVSAGPIGFGTSWIVFSPQGMSFDAYFGMSESQGTFQKFCAFLVGLSPRLLHKSYFDRSTVSFANKKGPSNMLSCQLCAGVVGGEVLKIAIGRGTIKAAPYYHQFDSYRLKYKSGRVWGGGKSLIQRLKRMFVERVLS